MTRRDTIFALSSAPGRAAVAIVRISGPQAGTSLDAMVGHRPAPRSAHVAKLRDPDDGRVIDHAIALWFPQPRSFTGEDAVEFQLHGSRAVVAAVLAALGRRPGFRLAEPGEFTRRAVRQGKLDLAAVEGLADLIDAQTEAQRRQAVRLLDGGLRRWAEGLRAELVRGLAAAEAAIDFADEGDVAGDFETEVRSIAAGLDDTIAAELAASASASQIREGLVVTLAGPPNAGKSTLLNALARREVAIVSPIAGTTRDAVEVQLDLGGFLVTCIDTAGLRESEDPIERAGMARARDRARSSDLVLWLFDARRPQAPDPTLAEVPMLRIATHGDCVDVAPPADHVIAAPTGDGVPALIEALRSFAAKGVAGEPGLLTRERHRRALEAARDALAPLRSGSLGMELAAVHLRQAAACLDRLVGGIETDDVLGEILTRFCVGK